MTSTIPAQTTTPGATATTTQQIVIVDYYPYMSTHWAGTVRKNFVNFSARDDASELRKALGPNETGGVLAALTPSKLDSKPVMAILCNRSNAERQEIKREYNALFNRDLTKDLIKELSGNFETLIVALMYTPEDYDALEIHHAIGTIKTDKHVLIEILCTRTNKEVRAIRASYLRIFGEDLETAIANGTSGDVKNVLTTLCLAARDESWRMDAERAREQVRAIALEGEKNWNNPESQFLRVMVSSNYAHLQQVFREYQTYTAHPLEESVGKAFSGDMQECISAMMKAAKNLPAYFAELIRKATKGMGSSDRELIRVIVSRSEKDLNQIKEQFNIMYNKPLQHVIEEETTGDFKSALLLIVRGA